MTTENITAEQDETVELTPEATDRLLRRVAGLLAKADDQAATPEESATYRAKAETLMQKYRLAEDALIKSGGAPQLRPVVRTFIVCNAGSQYYNQYFSLAARAARHAGVRYTYNWTKGHLNFTVVGYDADCRYAEALFLGASLVFQENVEPVWDDAAEWQLNAYRFRNAGKTRREIAVRIWGRDVDRSVHHHQQVQRAYEAEALRRGITVVAGRAVSRKDFIKVYCESFLSRFTQRLRLARDASDSITGELVFAGREDAIDEAFYEVFPELRPSKAVEKHEEYVDKRTQAQKDRDNRRYDREAEARRKLYGSAAGRAGWQAGTEAADKVQLAGVEAAKRLDD